MKWFDDLKRDARRAREELKTLSDQGRLSRENGFEVPPEELRQFNTQNLPAVTTFIRDIGSASRTPTMTQIISVLAGEEGKTLGDHFRETFAPEWRTRAQQNLDRDGIGDILKTLSAFAASKGHNPASVSREFEIRSAFAETVRKTEGNRR